MSNVEEKNKSGKTQTEVNDFVGAFMSRVPWDLNLSNNLPNVSSGRQFNIRQWDHRDTSGLGKSIWNYDEMYDREDIYYDINSLKYRSEELTKENMENGLLTSGCSFTFGVGISQEHMWSKLLANHLNLHHINLAVPGMGHEQIIYDIFQKVALFGKPKAAAILFPNPDRYLAIAMDYDSDGNAKLTSNPHDVGNSIAWNVGEEALKMIDQAMSYENALAKFLQHAEMLETFFAALDVPYFWSSWDVSLEKAIYINNKKYNHFKNFVPYHSNKNLYDFHQEAEQSKNWDHILWDIGRDAHPGIKDNEIYYSLFKNAFKSSAVKFGE